MPGPMVEATLMLFKYVPFADAGLARTSASINVLKLSSNCARVNDDLPMIACTIAAALQK